jgi:hypothetical protein
MKYMTAKAVRAISNARTAKFASTALKYPHCRMLEKTRTWRKMAPPKQPKPKLWTIMLMGWLSFWLVVIVFLGRIISFARLKNYEI